MPRYVLHFGHNVYLTPDGGMSRKVTDARVFYNRSEALKTAKQIVRPPFCAAMNQPPSPPEVEEQQGNATPLELQLDCPPNPCRLPN